MENYMSAKKVVGYAVVIAVLLAAGGYYGVKSWFNHENAMVRPMLTAMTEQAWSPEVMQQYSTPKFISKLNNPGNQHAFAVFRSLGAIVKYQGVYDVKKTLENNTSTLVVKTAVRFERAAMNVTLTFHKINGQWKVNDIGMHHQTHHNQ
jgi:hypothetical protein